MSTSSRKPTAVQRYIVAFWDAPDVSYNCGLGAANARRWALDAAHSHGGRVIAQYTDGTEQEVRPFGASFGTAVLPSEA